MSRIFTRSPFYCTVNNGSANSKVELFIWNEGTTEPVAPTQTLSKVSPTVTNNFMQYNVSSYIREYINFISYFSINIPSVPLQTNVLQWCNVRIKVYGNGTLISNTVYKAFDGWTKYTDGANYDNGSVMLESGNYYYYLKELVTIPTVERAGNLTIDATTGWTAKYTNLNSGSTFTLNLLDGKTQDIFRVYRPYQADGNLLEIFDGSSVLQKSFEFRPMSECRYAPVTIDFINKYGAWQRQFFFKASNNTMESISTQHNVLVNDATDYDLQQGQRREFNTRMIESIKVNSGLVNDFFGQSIMEQFMLSEKILVNELPAVRKTNSLEKIKEINTKIINYPIELQFAFDVNNTVI